MTKPSVFCEFLPNERYKLLHKFDRFSIYIMFFFKSQYFFPYAYLQNGKNNKIKNDFSFLSDIKPSILLLEGGLSIKISDSWEVAKVASCIISKDKGFSLGVLLSIRISKFKKIQGKCTFRFCV